MKKEIRINQKELEKWWNILNNWEIPKDLKKPMTRKKHASISLSKNPQKFIEDFDNGEEAKKQFIRGAFAVVDYIINWKLPDLLKIKNRIIGKNFLSRYE